MLAMQNMASTITREVTVIRKQIAYRKNTSDTYLRHMTKSSQGFDLFEQDYFRKIYGGLLIFQALLALF